MLIKIFFLEEVEDWDNKSYSELAVLEVSNSGIIIGDQASTLLVNHEIILPRHLSITLMGFLDAGNI